MLKNKAKIYLAVLSAIMLTLVPMFVLADIGQYDFFSYNPQTGLGYFNTFIPQWLIGGTSTTTNAKLEVQGGLAFDNATGTGTLSINNLIVHSATTTDTLNVGTRLKVNDTATLSTTTVGETINRSDFPLAKLYVSQNDSGHIYTNFLGIVGEAASDGSKPSIGIGGASKGSNLFPGIGVSGRAKANSSSDAANLIGVQGLSEDTHTGGDNIAVYGSALGGKRNYSFYGVIGNIYSQGNIGIATTTGGGTFGEKLTVIGDGYFKGNLYISGNIGSATNPVSSINATAGIFANVTTTNLYSDDGVNIGSKAVYKKNNQTILNASSTNYGLFVGVGAGRNVKNDGYWNTALGHEALFASTSSDYNTAIGYRALYSNQGDFNSGLGYTSLYNNTTGRGNFGTGPMTLYNNKTGNYNYAGGYQTLYYNTSGSSNVGLGYNALYYNTAGTNNISLGFQSLYRNTSGNFNTAIGNQSLFNAPTSSYNFAAGYQALNLLTSGSGNLALGYKAGNAITNGSNNVLIGYKVDASNLASNATAIGYQSYANTNATAIGANTQSIGIGSVTVGVSSYAQGNYSSVIAGINSTTTGAYSSILTGINNLVDGDYSSIIAGQRNHINGSNAVIAGGSDNNSSGSYTGIFNSKESYANGTSSVVLGGRYAKADGELATIIGGEYNYASGWDATLIANTNCTSTGHGAFVMDSEWSEANGYGSMIIQSSYTKTDGFGSSAYGTIGVNNLAQFSQVFGSIYSNVADTALFSLMMNSSSSDIYGPRSVIIGGDDNTISNAYSMILGGQNNTVSGMFSYAMGSGVTVSGSNSFGINLTNYGSPMTVANNNTMSIMGGNVGIGTTTPGYELVVDGESQLATTSVRTLLVQENGYDGESGDLVAPIILFNNIDDPEVKTGVMVYAPTTNNFILASFDQDNISPSTTYSIYGQMSINATSSDRAKLTGLTVDSYSINTDFPVSSNVSAIHSTYQISSDYDGSNNAIAFNRLIGATLERRGTIDGYGTNVQESNIGMRNWMDNAATYAGANDIAIIQQGHSVISRDSLTLNSSGKTLTTVDTGYYIDSRFTGIETAGTLNVDNIGLNVDYVKSDGATITNGRVDTYGIKINEITGHATGETFGIYDSSGANWYLNGNLGVNTTTPNHKLTIQDDNFWLSLSEGNYGLNFSFDETGTFGLPMISGLASSTAVIGVNLSGVTIEDNLIVAADEEDETSALILASKSLSSVAELFFDFNQEILAFLGAKSYAFESYDESEFFAYFDAYNKEVGFTGTTTIGMDGRKGVIRVRDNDDAGWTCLETLNGSITSYTCDY